MREGAKKTRQSGGVGKRGGEGKKKKTNTSLQSCFHLCIIDRYYRYYFAAKQAATAMSEDEGKEEGCAQERRASRSNNLVDRTTFSPPPYFCVTTNAAPTNYTLRPSLTLSRSCVV